MKNIFWQKKIPKFEVKEVKKSPFSLWPPIIIYYFEILLDTNECIKCKYSEKAIKFLNIELCHNFFEPTK